MELGFWGSGTAQVIVQGLCAGYSSKPSPEQRSQSSCEVCIFSWLTPCNWRPGKIPGVWGIVEEMFHA